MTTRRTLLKGATAAVLGAATASTEALAAPLAEPSLELLMVRELSRALGSESVAQKLAPLLFDATMLWSYPQMQAQEANALIAYSFGNRLTTAADKPPRAPDATEPGPINAKLAEAVFKIRAIRKMPVYAQWEIAAILQDTYRMDQVIPIYPERDADGKLVYLSTEGVAKAVLREAGGAGALGHVAIVGHRDHVKRCILTSKSVGLAAAAISGIPLPVEYDTLSGQPWTRDRATYLLGDIMAQLMMERSALLAQL
ncbi:twin-arginine translocation signal domain-containing protein [Novosphingobium terrae]|uniref:twin-arginine translocation signal domain-containing protein n=1 Tax=Novosphingobium terrae TaxID=2726189 RepID=UPI00197CC129|nr:twin-arginine translocation signal domain-containing protein [Novosphingobium terrae]